MQISISKLNFSLFCGKVNQIMVVCKTLLCDNTHNFLFRYSVDFIGYLFGIFV